MVQVLTLKILYPETAASLHGIKTFRGTGGTIGRARDRDWVLKDSSGVLSNKHCTISFRENRFWVVDTSTNGTFINSVSDRLTPHEPKLLGDNDIIYLGHFELKVMLFSELGALSPSTPETDQVFEKDSSLIEANGYQPAKAVGFAIEDIDASVDEMAKDNHPVGGSVSDQFSKTDGFHLRLEDSPNFNSARTGQAAGYTSPQDSARAAGRVNPLGSSGTAEETLESLFEQGENKGIEQGGQQRFEQSQEHIAQKNIAQENIDSSHETLQASSQISQRNEQKLPDFSDIPSHSESSYFDKSNQNAPLPNSGYMHDSQAFMAPFFKGMGVSPKQLSTEDMFQLGQIFRQVTEDLMALSQLRNDTRSKFRMAVTTIQKSDNNPLKCFVNFKEVFDICFSKESKGYKGAAQSYKEVCRDLLAHDFAMLKGMSAGFYSVLKAFSPKQLKDRIFKRREQKQFKRLFRNEDHWQLFCEFYDKIDKDSDATYNILFGKAFCAAYEAASTELSHQLMTSDQSKVRPGSDISGFQQSHETSPL